MSLKLSNSYIVYRHTSPSGKVYIGITSYKAEIRWNNGKGYIGEYKPANPNIGDLYLNNQAQVKT